MAPIKSAGGGHLGEMMKIKEDVRWLQNSLMGSVRHWDFGGRSVVVILTVWIVAAVAFLWSRAFVVGYLLNHTFSYTETGYRVANGQLPGIDFTNAMGIFAFLPHALGYRLTGDLAQAVPISFVIYSALILLAALYISITRLDFPVGTAISLTCSFVVMAPWILGYDSGSHLNPLTTAAMYYNRFGFASLVLVALLVIEPKMVRRTLAWRWDWLFSSAIFGMAFYTKMPFGLAVICLVAYWSFLIERASHHFKFFCVAIILIMLAVELMAPGLNLAYFREMSFASHVVKTIRLRPMAFYAVRVIPELLVLCGLPMLLLYMTGRLHWRRAGFFVCLIGGSLVLRSVSTQGSALLVPLAVATAVVAWLSRDLRSERDRLALAAAGLAFTSGILNYFPPASASLLRHATIAGSLEPIHGLPKTYAGLRVPKDADLASLQGAFEGTINPGEAYVSARSQALPSVFDNLLPSEYVTSLDNLTIARAFCGNAGNRTAILDFANVSSSFLAHPPVGGYTYVRFDRSFDEAFHLQPERMFSGVDCIFDPKLPVDPEVHKELLLVYGTWLDGNFKQVGESEFWRVMVRKNPG